ncbi:MAG: hypothetical protein L3J71_11385 [Victivallaceae bacterium]|nr:hypothetical protein [Victivallaceae bacterium]
MKYLLTILLFGLLACSNLHAKEQSVSSQGFTISWSKQDSFKIRKGELVISQNSLFLVVKPGWKKQWFWHKKFPVIVTTGDNFIEVKTDKANPTAFKMASYKVEIINKTTVRISVKGKLTEDVKAFVQHVPFNFPATLLDNATIELNNRPTVTVGEKKLNNFTATPNFSIKTPNLEFQVKIKTSQKFAINDRRVKPFQGGLGLLMINTNTPVTLNSDYNESIELVINSVKSTRPTTRKADTKNYIYPDSTLAIAQIKKNYTTPRNRMAKFSWQDYENLLKELAKDRYMVLPIRDYVNAKAPDKVLVGMRHDIDFHPFKAEKMAELEQKYKLRSTFYILHSANYYGRYYPKKIRRNTAMNDLYKKLNDQGFEIGIHNDTISLMLKYDIEPLKFIHEEIAYYNKIGIQVNGVASHGAAYVLQMGLNNTYMFSEFGKGKTIERNGKKYQYGQYSLKEFGFDYSAYRTNNNRYFSDVGGKWRANGKKMTMSEVLKVLKKLKPGTRVQILTHPVWWGK